MLRAWLLAKSVSMTSIGVFITVGLFILHIPLAGTLGIIAALMTFIPNIGAILSFIPARICCESYHRPAHIGLVLPGAFSGGKYHHSPCGAHDRQTSTGAYAGAPTLAGLRSGGPWVW